MTEGKGIYLDSAILLCSNSIKAPLLCSPTLDKKALLPVLPLKKEATTLAFSDALWFSLQNGTVTFQFFSHAHMLDTIIPRLLRNVA